MVRNSNQESSRKRLLTLRPLRNHRAARNQARWLTEVGRLPPSLRGVSGAPLSISIKRPYFEETSMAIFLGDTFGWKILKTRNFQESICPAAPRISSV